MANSDKDIKITPNTGESASPKIEVTGADNATKTITINDDGTISFDSTIAATSGSVANGNVNLVTGDAVFDYIALQGFSTSDNDVNVSNLTARLPQITESVTIGDATDVTVTTSGDLTVTGDLNVSSIIDPTGTGNLKLQAGSSYIHVLDGGVSNHINVNPASGRLNLLAETLAMGDADVTVTTRGAYDLTLDTNGGTNSGSIKILDGANGNIELDNNGSGQVVFKGNSTKGSGQFVLNCEQNSHGIVVKGPPHSAGASYTLTLPDDDGAANQVLKTDGSGNLSWVDQGSGGISDVSSDTTPQLGGDLDVNGNKITSASNADVTIEPNGTGDINLFTDKVIVGDASTNFEIQHRTTTNSLLQFQAGGNTRLVSDAAIYINADEAGTSSATGSLIRLNAITTNIGKHNNNATLTTSGTGDLTLSTNSGTNSGTIKIFDGANGNITLTPNGTGNVVLGGPKVQIGPDTVNPSGITTGKVTISRDSTDETTDGPTLMLVDGDDDSSPGPVIKLYRNTASPADNDVIGQLLFSGEDSSGGERTYGSISARTLDVTSGTRDSEILLKSTKDGSDITTLTLHRGAVKFNDAYTFPTSDGSNGQVLTTDGSGTLSFTTVSGGGSGAVSAVANGSNNRIATFSSTDALNGEANLTFDGSTLSVNDAGIDIREQYGRLNFKKDASTGFVNNYAIFFYNNTDSIRGAINFNNSGERMGFQTGSAYQIYLQDGVFYPVTDDDVDLGKSTNKFKDSFFGLVDAENFKINGGQGSDGQVLTSTGSGVAWETPSGGGGSTSPAGSDGQVQYNNSGSFGGDADFVFDDSNNRLVIGSVTSQHDSLGKLTVKGTDAGFLLEKHDNSASGGPTMTLYRYSASVADGDLIGQVNFRGEGSTGNPSTYISVRAEIEDTTEGTKDAALIFRGLINNSQTNLAEIHGAGLTLNQGSYNIGNASTDANTVSGSSLGNGSSVTLFTVPVTTRGFRATIYVKDTSNTEYQIEEIIGYNTGSGVDFSSFGQVYSGSAPIGSLNATNSSGTTLIQFTNGQGSAINYQATISVTHMDLS